MALLFLFIGVTILLSFLLKYYVSDRLKIPAVTIYVLLGVFAGISFLKVYNEQTLETLTFISKLALGIIAFVIGSELDKNILKKLGKSILFISLFEAFTAFLIVSICMFFIYKNIAYALILGAVASATAPAATVYVIRQYRTKGPLTSTIMGVVGIDDAFALIIYVFASTFASNILRNIHSSTLDLVFKPLIQITLSFSIGIGFGFIFVLLLKKIRDNEIISMAIFSFILMQLGISEHLDISELLTIMAFGATIVNLNMNLSFRAKNNLEIITPLVLPLFFIFGGARLNIRYIAQVGIPGLIYTIARMTGKFSGALVGATLAKADPVIKKYTGFALLPQVGVAIALALSVNQKFGTGAYGKEGIQLSNIVINILLFTTIITEIFGPMITRFALKKAGEIGLQD